MTSNSYREEKRHFFRTTDRVQLQIYRFAAPRVHQPPSLEDARFPNTERFLLSQQLQHIDDELHNSLNSMDEGHRGCLRGLELLNKKITLLSHALIQSEKCTEPVSINLTEAGIGLYLCPKTRQVLQLDSSDLTSDSLTPVANPLIPGQVIALRLWLLPEGYAIESLAKVKHVTQAEANQLVGLEFQGLKDSEQRLINRHLFALQARQQRMARATVTSVE